MPAREGIPRTGEAPLKKADREQLVAESARRASEVSAARVLRPEWYSIRPYMELIGMLGVLRGSEGLQSSEQAHLRKMIALQTSFAPRSMQATRSGREFYQEIVNDAGPELTTAETFPEDFKGIPRAWNNALSDVIRLQQALNPGATDE